MNKLMIATAILVTTSLASANSTESTNKTVATGHDAFYSIEDYNDPFYGDAYERKIIEQIPRVRFGK